MEPGNHFATLARKPQRLVLGLISGTSADAIDVACVRMAGSPDRPEVRVIDALAQPYPPGLRERLHALTLGGSTREICELNVTLGERFAEAAQSMIARVGPVDLIGSHGQTIYYIAPSEDRYGATLQIGEPAVIAERTGVPTVAHFRSRDMAAGGTGAPLVPYADRVLFGHPQRTRIVQNIGGIANATVLPAGAALSDVYAFDTGPGNMVIDALAERLLGRPMDRGGAAAAEGAVDQALLDWLLDDEFIAAPPPKATGRERYGAAYVTRLLERAHAAGVTDGDLLATVTAFTVDAIVANYERFIFPRHSVDEVILSGGGVHNQTLLQRLRRRLQPRPMITASALGVDDDAKEAVAFAVLAHDAVLGLPTNVPGATGAHHLVVLGAIYPGRVGSRSEAR